MYISLCLNSGNILSCHPQMAASCPSIVFLLQKNVQYFIMSSTDGSLMPFYSLPLTKECTIFYSPAYINENNKIANDILYGTVHRFYQAILYIENVIWFHGTQTHTQICTHTHTEGGYHQRIHRISRIHILMLLKQ